MWQFFQEGGWAMWPILVVGLIVMGSAAVYAHDREPVRLRFIGVSSLTLVVLALHGMLMDAAMVLWAVSSDRFPPEERLQAFLEGMKESTRPGMMGLGLLSIALILASIGVYRAGQRELKAARGG